MDENSGGPAGEQKKYVYFAFVTLAVLAGPVSGYAVGAILAATQLQALAGVGLASLIAGIVLVAAAAARRRRVPGARQWGALLLLLIPQWCSVPLSSAGHTPSWLHGIEWGAVLLLSLGAPLWLGLVAALDLVEVEVPRTVVAAAILGLGAVGLVLPTNSYSIVWNQALTVALQVLFGLASVISWVIARPRLAGWPTVWVAGGYLLLGGLGDMLFSLMYERPSWQALDARVLINPLLCDAALLAASWWLWFWLLERMTLAAFSMRALAAWVASAVVLGLTVIGFRDWRFDAALAIAAGAIVVALRVKGSEEQPVALGLGAS